MTDELPTFSTSTYLANELAPNPFLKDKPQSALRSFGLGHNAMCMTAGERDPNHPAYKGQAPMASGRLVRVFILDNHPDVPLPRSFLHKGDELLTELTDQELFFELPIKTLLNSHNEKRATLKDKKLSEKSGKDIMLEPIRIKDLKMIVLEIAKF